MSVRERIEEELCGAFRRQDWARADDLRSALDALDTPFSAVAPLAAALWYLQQGLRVFPLQAQQKVPFAGSRGVHEATTDRERVVRWWMAHPDANVGIATGYGVDVVDYDGEQAHVAWSQRFGATWGELEVLGTVSTPRPGGLHIYVPASGWHNRAGMVRGVDYRGRGGYVVAPPSVLDARPRQVPGSYRFLRHLRVNGPRHE